MFRWLKPTRCAAATGAALGAIAACCGLFGANAIAQQRQAPLFYDSRRLPDMEVERRNQEVLQEQRRVTDERRLDAEANAKRQADDKKLAAELERKALDEQKRAEDARIASDVQRKADEEKRFAADAEAKKKADDARVAALDAQRKADEDKRIAAQADAKKKADDARLAALEVQRKADEDKRIAAEADAKKKADDARVAALEVQRKADEDKKRIAEADARKKADDARVAALEVQRKADDDKKRVAESDAKKKADEARIAAETARKAEDEKRVAAATPIAAPGAATALIEPPRTLPPTQTAVLAPAITNSINPAVATGGACDKPTAQTSALAGGRMQVVIDSPCRKGQSVGVGYGTHDFVRKLDTTGRATLVMDLFLGKTEPVRLTYADGKTDTVAAIASDLSEVSKVALIWNSPVDLDLHAFENGATAGKPGHKWSGVVLTAEAAKAQAAESGRGVGFFSTIDDGTHDGAKVEVYTYYHSPEQPNGVVSMSLDFASRGVSPSGDTCGTGSRAVIPYEFIALSAKGTFTRERGIIPAIACGKQLSQSERFLRDAVPDLQFGK